jgi:hypothetical protein
MERLGVLIDSKLFRQKILSLDIRLMVKKNGLVNRTRPQFTNAADILPNIATKVPHANATNYSKNAGVATTASKASKNRKISSCFTFTNTTE